MWERKRGRPTWESFWSTEHISELEWLSTREPFVFQVSIQRIQFSMDRIHTRSTVVTPITVAWRLATGTGALGSTGTGANIGGLWDAEAMMRQLCWMNGYGFNYGGRSVYIADQKEIQKRTCFLCSNWPWSYISRPTSYLSIGNTSYIEKKAIKSQPWSMPANSRQGWLWPMW